MCFWVCASDCPRLTVHFSPFALSLSLSLSLSARVFLIALSISVCVCTSLEHEIRGSQPLHVFNPFSAVSMMLACAINIVRKFCFAGGQEPTVTCSGQRRPGDMGVQTYLQTLGPCASKIRGPLCQDQSVYLTTVVD